MLPLQDARPDSFVALFIDVHVVLQYSAQRPNGSDIDLKTEPDQDIDRTSVPSIAAKDQMADS
jgi:hypothetical protein